MATTTEPPTQPSGCSSTTTTNPSSSSSSCSPSCSISRCQQHRRTVRRQLQRWSKNVVYLVGFEEVAKSMMGPENWLKTTAQYSNNHQTSGTVATSGSSSTNDAQQQVLRDFDPGNPQVVHDPLCPMKISNMVDTIDQLTVPDTLPQLLNNNCSCDPPVDECPTCIDMMDNSSGNEDSISESSFNESSEQPLDLSIKGMASSPSTTTSKQIVSSIQESSKISRTSSPSILKPSTPRKSKAPKNWNRCYTEEALAQALDAIERGELGTRRAALIYKVPRSTLRNKVYKLNLRPSIRKKNAASNSNQEQSNSSTLSSLLLDRKRGTVSDPSNDSGFESSIKGHTSEALREMLLKRESVKSASLFQPQSTIPSSSSPFSSEPTHVGNVDPSLSTIPSFGMESFLTGSDPQTESLKFLYLIHLYQYAQQLQNSNSGSNLNSNQEQQQHNEAAPIDWQQILQFWNQFNCNGNNSLQCNPLLLNQSNIYESSMSESQSLKSRFDQESDQSRILGDYLSPFGAQQSFKSTPSATSIVNNNSGATGSSQVILKVPSYKSKGSRSQNTLIQSKPGAMMNISSPSSTLDQDEVGDDGFESKLIRIKSEESSLLETTKISRKKSRRSVENQSNHDQSNDGSNRNRPKRGRYRNYNREDLERAVKAVQDGSMSVHKAGNHFGVPHSTLEYKVKDRRTLRQKKQLQAGTDSTDELSTRNSRTSSTDSVPSNIPGFQPMTNDGNNDSNNNSLWNEQVSGMKSTEHSLFIASDKMRKLHEMVQNDGKNQSMISSSNGLFMVTSSKLNPSSVQSSSNPDSNDGQDDECMDVPECNPMQSSLNALKEVIGSSLPETAL